jgi:predicted double-glycine peptidase
MSINDSYSGTLVPLVRRAYDYSCGAASLASCLYYWGVWTGREPELYPLLKTNSEGTSGYKIMEVASNFGLQVQLRGDLSISDLRGILSEGWTVILNIQAWGNYTTETNFSQVWEDGHYVVLVNVTDSDIQIMDPSIAGRYGLLSIGDFESRWHDWSDDGSCKEYHTAILLRGIQCIDVKGTCRIT